MAFSTQGSCPSSDTIMGMSSTYAIDALQHHRSFGTLSNASDSPSNGSRNKTHKSVDKQLPWWTERSNMKDFEKKPYTLPIDPMSLYKAAMQSRNVWSNPTTPRNTTMNRWSILSNALDRSKFNSTPLLQEIIQSLSKVKIIVNWSSRDCANLCLLNTHHPFC